ncbi:MAG: hypothetical protein QM768_20400 [Agriterribacter sp.]
MKKEILDTILVALEKDAKAYQSDLQTFDTDNLDVNDQTDIDDISHKDQSTDISDDLLPQAARLDNTINIIKSYQAVSRNDCGPGALIETSEMYLLVGVSLPPVHVNNKKVAGITEDAKIYPAIKGKKKGDIFSLGDKDYTILSVS